MIGLPPFSNPGLKTPQPRDFPPRKQGQGSPAHGKEQAAQAAQQNKGKTK